MTHYLSDNLLTRTGPNLFIKNNREEALYQHEWIKTSGIAPTYCVKILTAFYGFSLNNNRKEILMEEQSFYEKRQEIEMSLHASVHNIEDKNSMEVWQIMRDYHSKGMQNTKEHYKLFHNRFIRPNMKNPPAIRTVPFYETTWLLLTICGDLKAKEYAVTDLIRFFDKKFKGRLTHNFQANFEKSCKQGNALYYKPFRNIINAARNKKPCPMLLSDNYRKLINMLALYSAKSRDHTLWAEAAKVVTSRLNSILQQATQEQMEKDVQLRISAVGNIGSVICPVYMPFITINIASFFNMLDIGLKQQLEYRPECRIAYSIKLPLLYTQSIMMTAAVEGKKAPKGVSPAAQLSKVLEVTENIRRKNS